MPFDAERARRELAEFRLEPLFVEELGWDRYTGQLDVTVDEQSYTLRGVAEKRGMAAFIVEGSDDVLPNYATRRKIERQAAKSVHEHLIVYTDGARTTQVWQWVRREPGRPTACRELHYQRGQSGEALIQRLDAVTFTLDEEADISIVDVTTRARAAFDVDRVTKRFYDGFKAEHDAFLKFMRGLKNQEDLEWYASVMLNRLMFVYFIQKKGFLDNDRDYLRSRLERVQQGAGRDQFHSFYRHFLLRLFHEGLGQRDRSSDLDKLLGRVPYLNGGLFDIHELERENPDIQIPDEAFEHLFDFFDAYQWHLDDRPLRADNEINPDVLGYIFEKYVNQKQMGAYYTKEDITGYITANTVIPRLFEKLAESSDEFDFAAVANLLASDPDRYIHEPLGHGNDIGLPEEIAVGMDDPGRRRQWNAAAPSSYALPTETWREVVKRRQHYNDLHARLAAGDVASAADLIALNLDLQQLALDLLETCDSSTLLADIYRELETLSVLDPTCGSGAFLFAALNILESLYDAALERMGGFLADGTARDVRAEFTGIIERVEGHPNRTFFVLKTIVVNNLYGVDVMEEAVEICKLRLFLRLVSQVERYEQLEPLPDMDFNIRAGNSVVGFANFDEVERVAQGDQQTRLDVHDALPRLRDAARAADDAFEVFRSNQLDDATDGDHRRNKDAVDEALTRLRAELDVYLAQEYGIEGTSAIKRAAWMQSHSPFHWAVEFHSTLRDGGFDAIIGNPPYLERRRLGGQYAPLGFVTANARDIYAWFIERSLALRHSQGRVGFIVPVSIVGSEAFAPLRGLLMAKGSSTWFANFAHRPSQLFEGAGNRLVIVLQSSREGDAYSTRYHRWNARGGEREHLFATVRYEPVKRLHSSPTAPVPKVGSPTGRSVLEKLTRHSTLGSHLVRSGSRSIYWVRVPGYFCQFFLRAPMARPATGGPERIRGEVQEVRFANSTHQRVAHAALNSTAYYFWHCAWTDGRHINPSDVKDFPLDLDQVDDAIADRLMSLSSELDEAFDANRSLWRKSGLLIDSVDSAAAKPVLDEIDRMLAEHYGFNDDELDFITNYDVKYRIGMDDE